MLEFLEQCDTTTLVAPCLLSLDPLINSAQGQTQFLNVNKFEPMDFREIALGKIVTFFELVIPSGIFVAHLTHLLKITPRERKVMLYY